MPMARLAEYLAELALMLGERPAVHFVRVEAGSITVVHTVEAEAIPKVRERVQTVGSGTAPPDAMRAYRSINKMLRDDNGLACCGRLLTPKYSAFLDVKMNTRTLAP
jgi:hypothetical protein